MHGRWTLSPRDYVKEVRRFRDEIGNLAWAAPQDWMCEPHMIARTGLSLDAHQLLTVQNLHGHSFLNLPEDLANDDSERSVE